MKLKNIIYALCPLLLVMSSSCKKLVEINPPITSISSDLIFTSDATATAAVVGIYSRMMSGGSQYFNGFASGGAQSVSLLTELSADGLKNYNTASTSQTSYIYANAILPTSGVPTTMWAEIYQYIYTANVILENLEGNTAITPAVSTQLKGEAKFIRAFCYFYLTNLYGDVPLLTTSNYLTNQKPVRDPQSKVIAQIIQDLLGAQDMLQTGYATSATQERVRPNTWAAKAFLARVYLYNSQWAEAEAQATAVINNSALFTLPAIGSDALNGLNTVFLKNSKETIWALKPVLTNNNTLDATNYVFPAGPVSGTYNVALTSGTGGLLTAFEAGDLRRTAWVGTLTTTGITPITYYYAYKYKLNTNSGTSGAVINEYNIVFRLSEQYLIRAEARAMQNNISGSALDLNRIRNGAGLANTTANDQASMRIAILQERRVELFCEWGHRWLDLKRTKTIDQVMTAYAPVKGIVWNTNYQFYPIPQSERSTNPNLTQNPGYN